MHDARNGKLFPSIFNAKVGSYLSHFPNDVCFLPVDGS